MKTTILKTIPAPTYSGWGGSGVKDCVFNLTLFHFHPNPISPSVQLEKLSWHNDKNNNSAYVEIKSPGVSPKDLVALAVYLQDIAEMMDKQNDVLNQLATIEPE
jgi:hypothetical protein